MPVASEIARTVAPEIELPDLSVTVPEKLPTACPYVDGASAIRNAKTPIMMGKIDFLHIFVDVPLPQPLGWLQPSAPTPQIGRRISLSRPNSVKES